MAYILASTPILLILVLMIGFRWGAARAGGAGYLCAVFIAIFFFGSGPELLAIAHMKALLLTIDVLLIIWAAFLLYRVVDEAGAIQVIGQSLPHLTPDRGMQAVVIGWVFASFLQGVGGFGVPVAVIAPILVGLGFAPLAAVVIPSIGHGWAVTFGSLGSSFNALLAATGQPDELLAPPAAIFLGVACLFSGYMVVHAAEGFPAIRRLFGSVLITGVVMALVQYLVAISGPWNVSAFTASLAGLLVVFPLALCTNANTQKSERKINIRELLVASSGYAILVAVTLSIQLIPSVKSWLGRVKLTLVFPEVSTSLGYVTPAGPGRVLPIFGHTGMILLYASILAFLVYHLVKSYKTGAVKRIVNGTMSRVMSSSVSIASMVAMAVVMEHAGMTDTLANGLAQGTGRLFPLVSPWIGALGAFMTGSNTNSNVVFGALQMLTAELIGCSVAIILGAQTAGAALASVMAPTKVVVGTSTAGMSGKEGDVMRKLLVYASLLVVIVSLLTILGVWLQL
jgi:lactate permease